MENKCETCGLCAGKEKKCECDMPLTEETKCACEPERCIHCCSCPKECECGCQEKAQKEKEEK